MPVQETIYSSVVKMMDSRHGTGLSVIPWRIFLHLPMCIYLSQRHLFPFLPNEQYCSFFIVFVHLDCFFKSKKEATTPGSLIVPTLTTLVSWRKWQFFSLYRSWGKKFPGGLFSPMTGWKKYFWKVITFISYTTHIFLGPWYWPGVLTIEQVVINLIPLDFLIYISILLLLEL